MRSETGRGAVAWIMLGPALVFGQAEPAAPSAGLALRWSDPSALSPITQNEFDTRLSERLGRPAFAATAGEQTLSVNRQGSPEQCRVELNLLRGPQVEGTRQLESPSGDCKSLAPALLTVAALLIESRPSAEPPAEAPAAAEPAITPSPEADSDPEPAEPSDPDREPLLLLSLGAQLSSGFAPKLELGPAAALVVAPLRHLRVGAAASLYFPREYGATPGLELSHGTAALLACGMPLTGALGLGACADVTVHRWSSTGISLPHPQASKTYSWSYGLLARAEWRLVKRLWWVGSVGAELASAPLYFYFTPAPGGEKVLFRQQRVAPVLFLGLTLELP